MDEQALACQQLAAEPLFQLGLVTAGWAAAGYLLFGGVSGALLGAVAQQVLRAAVISWAREGCQRSGKL